MTSDEQGAVESAEPQAPPAPLPSVWTFLETIIDGFLDLVYPPKCVVCQTLDPSYICGSCLSGIEEVPRPYCLTCGHPLGGSICRNCANRVRSFTAARAAGNYSGVLRTAIHEFKYGGKRMLADPLARLLHNYLKKSDFAWRRADCVVPVPIYPSRRRVRGYNQSELLAERLSSLVRRPLMRGALVRTRRTRPQVELAGYERRVNVRDAFRVRKSDQVKGKTVLLVDDVATTCSTIHECSLALLEAGAAGVYVVCLAFGA